MVSILKIIDGIFDFIIFSFFPFMSDGIYSKILNIVKIISYFLNIVKFIFYLPIDNKADLWYNCDKIDGCVCRIYVILLH